MKAYVSLVIACAASVSAGTALRAQGITVLSNLDWPPVGSLPVASDSWYGLAFRTGDDAWAYRLEDVVVRLAEPVGEVFGLSAWLYEGNTPAPWNRKRVLPLEPPVWEEAGLVRFDGGATVLSSGKMYTFVLTSEQPLASGAYQWAVGGQLWGAGGWSTRTDWHSADGDNWTPEGKFLPDEVQVAITVTPVPEPSSLALLALGGWWFWLRRRQWQGKGG